jgi:hypothetical protein
MLFANQEVNHPAPLGNLPDYVANAMFPKYQTSTGNEKRTYSKTAIGP